MDPTRARTRPSAAVGHHLPVSLGPPPAWPAKLVCTRGAKLGTEILLVAAEVVIGRSSDCSLHLPDASVSLRHALLRQHNGGWWLSDLGSSGGTQLNGVPVRGEMSLRPGDVLRCGDCELRAVRAEPVADDQDDTLTAVADRPSSLAPYFGAMAAMFVLLCAGAVGGSRWHAQRSQLPPFASAAASAPRSLITVEGAPKPIPKGGVIVHILDDPSESNGLRNVERAKSFARTAPAESQTRDHEVAAEPPPTRVRNIPVSPSAIRSQMDGGHWATAAHQLAVLESTGRPTAEVRALRIRLDDHLDGLVSVSDAELQLARKRAPSRKALDLLLSARRDALEALAIDPDDDRAAELAHSAESDFADVVSKL